MGIEQPSFIDETAKTGNNLYIGAFTYIGKNAEIGDDTKLLPQVYIGENVKVGKNCLFYPGVKVYDDCIIGDNCILHSGVIVGSDGFGFAPQKEGSYKKVHQIGNAILEDDVEIGANTTIDCGTMGSTIIRKGAKIDNLVQVAHNCEVGENTVIAAQTGMAGTTKIGRNCKFGGQVGIAGHLTIGDNVQVGAQSGIPKSVKDGEILLGTPAFNFREALKTYTIYRNLPKLREDLINLQKEVGSMKNK